MAQGIGGIGAGGGAGGGLISSAMELIKEKERQADKAMDRLHDGLKAQTEAATAGGSWTGAGGAPQKVVQKEKVVEKEKAPERELPDGASTAGSQSQGDEKENISDIGIIGLARGAGNNDKP